MKKIAEFVIKHPKNVIIISFVVTLILSLGMLKNGQWYSVTIKNHTIRIPFLRIDNNIKNIIPKDMPVRQALNKVEDTFGGSDVILIAINNVNYTIFNKGTLTKIKEISDALKATPGIRDVTSLSTLKHIEGKEWGLEVTPFMEEVPVTKDDIDKLRKVFFEDSTYVGQVISRDGKYAAIVALVEKDANEFDLYKEAKKLIKEKSGPEHIQLAGSPVIRVAVSRSIWWDILLLIPFVVITMIIILYTNLRNIAGVRLTLLPVLMAVLSTIGLMGYLGKPFMMINNTLPVMLIAMRTAHGFMVTSLYYELYASIKDKRIALYKTITDISTPLIMSGIAMMVGFASLIMTPLPIWRELGLFAAFGVFLSMIFALAVIPAFMMLLSPPKIRTVISEDGTESVSDGILDRFVKALSAWVNRFRRQIIASCILIVIIFGFGIPRIIPEMNPITFFKKNSEIRKTDAMVNEHLGGSTNMNILLDGDIQTPELLNKMDSIQQFLEKNPNVASTISIATIVKKINKALNANKPEFETIPATKEAIAQAILMYSMSGSPQDFERLVDSNYTHAQIIARMTTSRTVEISKIAKETQRYCDSLGAGTLEKINIKPIEITGYSMLLSDLSDMITRGHETAIVAGIIVIFLITWIIYRSFKIGMMACIPLITTLVIAYGLMGYAKIALSIPATILSGVIIGAGIDYSFYFISRYKLELANGEAQPLFRAIQTVGKPLLYNAVAVALGFIVFLLSGFVPIKLIGFLVALTMLICSFGSVTVLPAVLSVVKIEKRRG